MMCDIRKVAYSKFQFWWLMQHGYSMNDLFEVLAECAVQICEDGEDLYDQRLQDAFEEAGMNGSLYPCFEEFLDYEYQDKGLMKTLLSAKEYRNYRKDVKDKSKD